eukprot:208373-Prorocentrum_minimum.AAC.1
MDGQLNIICLTHPARRGRFRAALPPFHTAVADQRSLPYPENDAKIYFMNFKNLRLTRVGCVVDTDRPRDDGH